VTKYPPNNFSQCLERLPAAARARYRALQALVEDSTALARVAHERFGVAETRAYELSHRLDYLDPRDKSSAEDIKDLTEELEVVRGQMAKVDAERGTRIAAKSNHEQVLSQLDNFITALFVNGSPPLRAVTVEAAPRDGEGLADAVVRLRREIADAKAETQAVKAAPPSPEEIEAHIVLEVARLAKQGPRLHIEDGEAIISWPDMPRFGGAPGVAMTAPPGSATRLTAALHPILLMSLLMLQAKEITGGIPSAERAERLAELTTRLDRLERQEEVLVGRAIDAGLDVHRRPYASPWALLGIEKVPIVELVQAAEAAE
jgi:hypothetical protein